MTFYGVCVSGSYTRTITNYKTKRNITLEFVLVNPVQSTKVTIAIFGIIAYNYISINKFLYNLTDSPGSLGVFDLH